MDHRLIEEQNIAALYVAGQLPPEDEERFEEHLLECRECRERVAWAEDFKGSFQAMAVEDGTRAAGVGLLAWLARRSRWLGAAALVLLAVALPAWLLVERGRLRRELAVARAARPTPPPSVPAPSPQAGEAELRAEAELRRLESELQAAREERERLAGQLAELTRPQVNTAVFSLGLVRGEEEANQVLVGPEPAWIVLSLELPPADVETYRATLLDARGQTVWRGEGLRPTASDTLVLGLYSDLLAPGAYRLVLEGLPPRDRPVTTEIPFRVARQG
jgi:HAMP domain-containing protein